MTYVGLIFDRGSAVMPWKVLPTSIDRNFAWNISSNFENYSLCFTQLVSQYLYLCLWFSSAHFPMNEWRRYYAPRPLSSQVNNKVNPGHNGRMVQGKNMCPRDWVCWHWFGKILKHPWSESTERRFAGWRAPPWDMHLSDYVHAVVEISSSLLVRYNDTSYVCVMHRASHLTR